MDDKDRAEACIRLAEFAASRHDARRNEEWRLNAALWGSLLGAIVVSHQYEIELPVSLWARLVGALGLVGLYATMWLRPIWVANERDKRRIFFFRTEAARLIDGDRYSVRNRYENLRQIEEERPSFAEFARDWSMRIQFLITVWLVLSACWLINGA